MENSTPKGHPKGLYLLFTTEMWERFSYYGMRALFTLFLINALMFNKETASGIYGSYTSLVYLTPIIGGYFADNIWGNRKSIFVGGIMMAIGQLFMFLSASFYANHSLALILMIVGLTFLIFGNGFFKPNISTLVGQLYSETDKRKDAAYTIFYMGINLGAFIAPLICGYLGERYNEANEIIPGAFKWGFLCACIGMIISVISFELRKDKVLVTPEGEPIGKIPNKQRLALQGGADDAAPVSKSKNNVYVGVLIGMLVLVVLRLFVFAAEDETTIDTVNNYISAAIFAISIAIPFIIITDKSLNKVEKQRIWVIYIVAFFVIFFWAAFEQAGASLTFFAAEQTNRDILGFSMPASWFNSFNAVFIVILAPLISIMWTKLAKRGLEPASPYKQAYGLFFLALGYVFIAIGVDGVEPGVKVSIIWLTGLYFIHTIGELFLSPIGLSMVNKLAPVRFASLLMGVWFLSTAAANNFAGFLSSFYPDPVLKGAEVRALEKEFTTDTYKCYLLADEVKTATLADTVKVTDDKGKEVEVKYSDIKFDRLLPEVKDKKDKAAIEANGKIIQEKKIEFAKRAVNKEKSFIGIKITDLKSFFWLFVYLAGGSAIVLFLLSKLLVKMMNGVK
ncbi:peptide MFS transporter [Fluviicola sp.]|uniref:peptide MFS transporter n=1 Tax=Fluviicola sp. TaxID=1917219 RepID=UPI0031D83CAD